MPCAKGKALSSEAHPPILTGLSLLGGPDSDISSFWMKNGLKKQFEEESRSEESSNTDDALLEEALRYGTASAPIGLLVLGSPSSPSSFSGRTPLREYYDFFGVGWEIAQGETPCRNVNGSGSTKKKTVTRWELMEVNNGSNGESGEELCLVHTMPQEVTGWEEVNWEDSDLARFSKFLGFSTKSLEKDILDFLVKIRKRRERVHSKVLLEKLKFERELKRVECSINYEGGRSRSVVSKKEGARFWKSNEVKVAELECAWS